MVDPHHLLELHAAAPDKPAVGAPCNGCGVCCALETCPAARLLFGQRRGPCPALQWSEAEACYRCGLLVAPEAYLAWLPKATQPLASRLFRRWIAAGIGCDCDARIL